MPDPYPYPYLDRSSYPCDNCPQRVRVTHRSRMSIREDGARRQHSLRSSTTPPVPPRRLDVTMNRSVCAIHKDVTVKKVKLFKTKEMPCYKCAKEERDAAVAAEQAAQQRIRAVEAALEAEKAAVVALQTKNEDMAKEQAVMEAQMAKLMDQIVSLSEELSDALAANDKRLKKSSSFSALQLRSRSSALQEREGPTSSLVIQGPGGTCDGPPRRSPQQADSPAATAACAAAAAPLAAAAAAASSTMSTKDRPPLAPPSLPTIASAKAPSPLPPPPVVPTVVPAAAPDRKEGGGAVASVKENGGTRGSSQATAEQQRASASTSAAVETRPPIAAAPPMQTEEGALAMAAQSAAAMDDDKKRKGGGSTSKWVAFSKGGPKKKKADKKKGGGKGHHLKEEEQGEEGTTITTPAAPVDELDEPLSIKELTSKLLRRLETYPHDLKRVYAKSEALAEWRLELLCDMQLRTQQQGGGAGNDEQATRGLFVSDEMDGVKRLLDTIKKTVFMYVEDCFNVSKSDPELLVQALEVVRQHQLFDSKKADIAKRKVNMGEEGSLEKVLRACSMDDWDAQVVSTVKCSATDRAIEVFTVAHVEAADGGFGGDHYYQHQQVVAEEGLSRIQAMLYASRRLLEDLGESLGAMQPLFPAKYRVGDIVRHAYDDHLTRQIMNSCQGDISDFEVGDLLELRHYLDDHVKEMARLGQESPREELVEVKQTCYTEYLFKTYQQMTEWFDRILKRESPVLFDNDGRPVTTTPEDLFQIILCHLEIASAGVGLGGADLVSFILVVLNVLKAFVAEHLNTLRTVKQRRKVGDQVEVATVAAYINDYDRLQDKVADLRDQLFLGGRLDESHLSTIDPVLDQLKEEVMKISLESNTLLAYLVLRDSTATLLKGSPFDSHSTTRVVDEALLTFADYFSDLRVWLPQYFYSATVRTCFECLVPVYVLSVLRGTTALHDPLQTAQDMRRHKQAIKTAMEPYATELMQAGMTDQQVMFVVMDDLHDVVEKGPKIRTAWTGYLLRDLPPPWNVDAVMKLVQLRGGATDKPPPTDKKGGKQEETSRARMLQWFDTELRDKTTSDLNEKKQRCPLWRLTASPFPSSEANKDPQASFLWDLSTGV